MVEIEKVTFNKGNNIFCMKLVALFKEDIEIMKNFILKQHINLDRKDFFIIEDLDTELPIIFEEDKGTVYGIFLDDKLVATQAIDFSSKNDRMLRPYVREFLEEDCQICELGWTLVDGEFRGCHIGEYLLKYIEKQITSLGRVLVATVHPENVIALGLYLRNGFKGYSVGEYYGYHRMFLIKTYVSCNTNFRMHVECKNLEEIEKMFKKGYVCSEVVRKEGKLFLSFSTTNM